MTSHAPILCKVQVMGTEWLRSLANNYFVFTNDRILATNWVGQ